ncbi:glycosyltransferase [Zobellia russellii]|uniref:glycosyltransferase n=1 Tax=Zobellia russellii TaxID=248907 RepID=UPI001BFFD33F|nr:glycosyltransferase [Zobellia russellii]MBT9186738.1 glycosyltransferase [Zobellia russellii]
MKNICITINSLNRGGAEKQCLLLAKALKNRHRVTVVILRDKPVHKLHLSFIENEKIEHLFLPSNPLKKTISFVRFLKRNKIDIVFSFLPTDSLFSAILGKISGVPYVFSGIRNSYMARTKFISLKWVNNNIANYTIANNFAAYRAALEYGFKKNVFVISNGIEIETVPERIKTDKKIIQIISLGRLVKQKEYGTALKSMVALKKHLGNTIAFKYTIVGQGPDEGYILKTIKECGLEKEVELVVNPGNIFKMLLAADIYLCTSSFEGVSNAIMEAMNCSLPIVATDAGDNARLTIHGKNGFITEINDVENLSEYLKELILSNVLRTRMGKASFDHLVENFSYAAFQRNYIDLIDNIDKFKIQEGKIVFKEP